MTDKTIVMDGKELPAPTGANCPDHSTYPLVWKEVRNWELHGETVYAAWCRRGQHFVPRVEQ